MSKVVSMPNTKNKTVVPPGAFVHIELTKEQKETLTEHGIKYGVKTAKVPNNNPLQPNFYEYVILNGKKVALGYYNFGDKLGKYIFDNLIELLLGLSKDEDALESKLFPIFTNYFFELVLIKNTLAKSPEASFEERFKLVYDRELTVDDVKDYTNHLEEATKLYNRLYKK